MRAHIFVVVANGIKLFSFVTVVATKKAGVFFRGKFFQASQIFWVKVLALE
jgi:hypothetical protein